MQPSRNDGHDLSAQYRIAANVVTAAVSNYETIPMVSDQEIEKRAG
jgi:hypothetical protein